MDKFSELKDALEFLEETEFDGEWDSALVGGENGKNYHAVINANDVVVRSADDSRHTSWLCDYLEAVSPVKIRALLEQLEAKDKRIAELERITEGVDQLAIDGGWTARGMSEYAKSLERRLATPVRLPSKNDDEFWFDGVFQVAKFDRAVERAISAAGFKFVGDE